MRRSRGSAPARNLLNPENNLLVNWGNRAMATYQMTDLPHMLNRSSDVATYANKLSCFNEIRNMNHRFPDSAITIPEYTVERREASQWLRQGFSILARESATGTGGNGITIVNPTEARTAPERTDGGFYVKFEPSREEFRVYFMDGQVLDYNRKSIRNGTTPTSRAIRSHDNGYIFTRNNFELPDCVRQTAERFIAQTSLSFGGIDILHNSWYNKAVLLEVNTAPGIEGTNVILFADKLLELADR
jgi:hypothetical protein